jgi:hypothetical protein
MQDDEPEFSPLPSDAPTEDRIGTALLSMGSAAAASVTWFSILTFIGARLAAGETVRSAAQINPNAGYVNFLVYGTVLGLGLTGVTAWLLLAPIPSTYRRGALAMVAALGGTSLAMVATYMVDQLIGRTALPGVAALALAMSLWLGRRAVRSGR